jgi:excisionase family DNA binding protein
MKTQATKAASDRLLTLSEVAAILGTSERFPRRLIAERRIEFVRVGRHVRIRESALDGFIASGVVAPITARHFKQGKVA